VVARKALDAGAARSLCGSRDLGERLYSPLREIR
jgi:hypothetical protein